MASSLPYPIDHLDFCDLQGYFGNHVRQLLLLGQGVVTHFGCFLSFDCADGDSSPTEEHPVLRVHLRGQRGTAGVSLTKEGVHAVKRGVHVVGPFAV